MTCEGQEPVWKSCEAVWLARATVRRIPVHFLENLLTRPAPCRNLSLVPRGRTSGIGEAEYQLLPEMVRS